jgi:hypothetical protein
MPLDAEHCPRALLPVRLCVPLLLKLLLAVYVNAQLKLVPEPEPTQGTAGANVHERLLKYVAEPGGMRGAPGPVSLTVIVHEVVPSFARELLKSIAILRT